MLGRVAAEVVAVFRVELEEALELGPLSVQWRDTIRRSADAQMWDDTRKTYQSDIAPGEADTGETMSSSSASGLLDGFRNVECWAGVGCGRAEVDEEVVV